MIDLLSLELISCLTPYCDRLEIAGSLRRKKTNPRDIEVVAIPKVEYEYDLFGNPINQTGLIDDWIKYSEEWELDPALPRNGSLYKRLRHKKSKVACDLFLTDWIKWGVIFTIRTGPGEFSQALMTIALQKGMKVDGGRLYRVHRDDTREALSTPEEHDVFVALGIPYIRPDKRSRTELIRVINDRVSV